MNDTTNLNDLPSTTGNHISMEMSQPSIQPPSNQPMSLDQSTISQIVNGLQQASLTGATRLPSRDIPMTSTHLTTDVEIMPNYVPKENKYINDDDDLYVDPHRTTLFDRIYNNVQFPLLLAILFFIFQLPAFKNVMSKYLSFLFLSDGNYNMNGLTFLSITFAMTYYVLTSVIFASI
jgi:hypothetical protein